MHKAYKKGFISSAATDDILTGADPENAPKVKDPRMYSKRAQKLVERVAKIRKRKELLAEFLKQGAWSVDLTSTDWIAQATAMVFIEVNLEAACIGSDVALPSGGLLRSFANSKSTG